MSYSYPNLFCQEVISHDSEGSYYAFKLDEHAASDHYASLDDLCRSENLERSAIESSLASVDYVYDPDTNQFT